MILVTGGAGFIGSNLVHALIERGERVRVLDNLSTGIRSHLYDAQVDFIIGDVRDRASVRRALEGVERVVHLAATISVQESLDNPLLYFEVNQVGSLNLFEACRQVGVKRVVAASSAAIYGSTEGRLSEEQVGEPLSPYAASKLSMETSARLYNQLYSLGIVVLRFFNVYGPRQPLTSPYAAVIPRFIQSLLANRAPVIYGDGEQTRDFVHVQDVVQACLLALYIDKLNYSAINIASGNSTSINQLASFLHRILPHAPEPMHADPREGEIYHSVAAIERAAQALGYRPEIALEDGLDSTVEWFRKSA